MSQVFLDREICHLKRICKPTYADLFKARLMILKYFVPVFYDLVTLIIFYYFMHFLVENKVLSLVIFSGFQMMMVLALCQTQLVLV